MVYAPKCSYMTFTLCSTRRHVLQHLTQELPAREKEDTAAFEALVVALPVSLARVFI